MTGMFTLILVLCSQGKEICQYIPVKDGIDSRAGCDYFAQAFEPEVKKNAAYYEFRCISSYPQITD